MSCMPILWVVVVVCAHTYAHHVHTHAIPVLEPFKFRPDTGIANGLPQLIYSAMLKLEGFIMRLYGCRTEPDWLQRSTGGVWV